MIKLPSRLGHPTASLIRDTYRLRGETQTFWLIVAGLFVMWLFFRWEHHRLSSGREPLVRPDLLDDRQLGGGLIMFLFQYLLQAGVFFVVPLFLSVALGLSAIETGLRILPLSFSLLIAAVGVPKVWPQAPPRRVVQVIRGCCDAVSVLARVA